jgi:hypothetical protein
VAVVSSGWPCLTSRLHRRSLSRVINGVHLLLYSADAAADRAFIRDVLGYPFVEDVDSEPGWLIFKLPPAELGVHPTVEAPRTTLSLMCDDLDMTLADLHAKGVTTGEVFDLSFGRVTTMHLPSGATLGLYQAKHPTAFDL